MIRYREVQTHEKAIIVLRCCRSEKIRSISSELRLQTYGDICFKVDKAQVSHWRGRFSVASSQYRRIILAFFSNHCPAMLPLLKWFNLTFANNPDTCDKLWMVAVEKGFFSIFASRSDRQRLDLCLG